MCQLKNGRTFSDIIKDKEILFKYIHPSVINVDQNGERIIPPSIFNDPELSCDWEVLQKKPENSFHIDEGKTQIIEITVCEEIRNPTNPKRQGELVPAWHQTILHDPVSEDDDPRHGANQAHVIIMGKKKQAVTEALVNNSVLR